MTGTTQPYWHAGFMAQTHAVRAAELERVLPLLRQLGDDARLLEIGGGDGWQARELSKIFENVTSIDLDGSVYVADRIFPVIDYDGFTIPLADDSCDIVFSSNVLEHIPHIEAFQQEIQRVLAPGGRAIHVLPSASWRFWGSVLHCVALPRNLFRRIVQRLQHRSPGSDGSGPDGGVPPVVPRSAQPGTGRSLGGRIVRLLKRGLFDPRHGERGSAFSELWLFSRPAWLRLFRRTGWVVEACETLHLAYTGHVIFGTAWSAESRTRCSRLFGSSTHVTVLKAADDPPPQRSDRIGS